MKRTANTRTKKEAVGELLRKLRELDQNQLVDVQGGLVPQASAQRGKCGSHCMHC